MCHKHKKHRDTTIIRADLKNKKGKAHTCLTLLIEMLNYIILIAFYAEQRVRKQLLDNPFHLNAEIIR
jgi:hypothetical protein